MTIRTVIWNELDELQRDELLRRPATDSDAALREDVAGIIADVRYGGDRGVRNLTRRLDGVDIADPRVGDDEVEAATQTLGDAAIDAIDLAIDNVRKFHEAQVVGDVSL